MANEFDKMNIRRTSVMNRPNAGLDRLMGSMTGEKPATEIVEVVPENALVELEDGSLQFRSYRMTSIGLMGGEEADEADWAALLAVLFKMQDRLHLVLGDALLVGERKWGATYQQVAEKFGREADTLRDYVWVCKAVNLSLRKDKLNYNHYKAVAGMEADDQTAWLEWALKNTVSARQLVKYIADSKKSLPTNVTQLVLPGFAEDRVKARRKHETRLTAWQEGKLNLSPTEALDEINGLIEYWTVQRESLIDQTSDGDNNPYQE